MHIEQPQRVQSIIDDPQYQQTHSHFALRFRKSSSGSYAYSPAAAYLSATASAWAYSDARTLIDQVTDVLERPVKCLEFEARNPAMYLGTDAYLLYTDDDGAGSDLGILVFRGTEVTRVEDFLADAFVEMVDFPSRNDSRAKVHAGFMTGTEAIWKRVYKMLVDVQLKNLIITGHSLGASLAVMTAAQIFRERELSTDRRFDAIVEALRGIYTFGQPAVGDEGFANWTASRFGALTFRHVYGNDLVPFLPTSDVNKIYKHFECGVWTCKRGEDHWSGPNENRSFAVARWFAPAVAIAGADFLTRRIPFRLKTSRALAERLLRYSLDDHSSANYLRVSRMTYLTEELPRSLREGTPALRGDGGSRRASA